MAACAGLLLTACSSSSNPGGSSAPTASSVPVTTGPGGTGTTGTSATGSGTTTGTGAVGSPAGVALYKDPAQWLCHPDLADAADVCRRNLDSTVLQADGSKTIERHVRATDPKIDCFYVYPTVSRDTTPNADRTPAEGEEILAAVSQTARLSSLCRVYAPIYRQIPLTGLFGGGVGGSTTTTTPGASSPSAIAYGDVVDAFDSYLTTQNKGRPFILIGHSQGSGHLNRLIKDKFDGDEAMRKKLVSAYLLGSGVTVPEGADVGGNFTNVPACRTADQTGCVVSYASFRSTSPPPADSLFGRPRSGDGKVLCTNPASLGGGSADLHGYYPNGTKGVIGNSDPVPGVDTPFVSFPGLVKGECVARDGFTWLDVTIPAASDTDPRGGYIKGDLTPAWGLHLIDANLAMGDIVKLATSQVAAHKG